VLLEHETEGAVRAVVDAQGTGEDVAAEQKLDVLAISGHLVTMTESQDLP
jgi:hypothetical protein